MTETILPVSVMTVTPEIVDVDYTYIILKANVLYGSKKTNLTAAQIQSLVYNGTIAYCNANLNTFNTTFIISDLIDYVKALDKSIVAVDYELFLQKRIVPSFDTTKTYTVYFGTGIERAYGDEALQFTPSFSTYDSNGNFYPNVYIEESPDRTTNIDSVNVLAGGSGYSRNSSNFYLALDEHGEIWAWGYNNYGQVGIGPEYHVNSGFNRGPDSRTETVRHPICLTKEVYFNGYRVVDIATMQESSFALTEDGTLWAWGRNNYGQLGFPTSSSFISTDRSYAPFAIPINWATYGGIQKFFCSSYENKIGRAHV